MRSAAQPAPRTARGFWSPPADRGAGGYDRLPGGGGGSHSVFVEQTAGLFKRAGGTPEAPRPSWGSRCPQSLLAPMGWPAARVPLPACKQRGPHRCLGGGQPGEGAAPPSKVRRKGCPFLGAIRTGWRRETWPPGIPLSSLCPFPFVSKLEHVLISLLEGLPVI